MGPVLRALSISLSRGWTRMDGLRQVSINDDHD